MAIERARQIFHRVLDIFGNRQPSTIPEMYLEQIVWKPKDLVEQFSMCLLADLGALNYHHFLEDQFLGECFRQKFNANILDAVFLRDNSESPIDDKRHHINLELEERLRDAFPHRLGENFFPSTQEKLEIRMDSLPSGSPNPFPMWEKAIDLETKYILTTMIIPALRNSGKSSLFVEDFMSTIKLNPGRRILPEQRYLPLADEQLREGVAYRIDKLKAELDRITSPNQVS